MAIRKSAWEAVADNVCLDDRVVHEDQDVALCMAAKEMIIRQVNDIQLTSINQSFRYLPKMVYYTKLRNKTKKHHLKKGSLPPPASVRIPMYQRIGSHMLSIPVGLYGLLAGLLLFPVDVIALKIFKRTDWFD